MKIKLAFTMLISGILAASCSKNDEPKSSPEPEITPSTQKEVKLSSVEVKFNQFLIDETSANNFYIRQVLDYQDQQETFKFSDLSKSFQALPIRISSEPYIGMKADIPNKRFLDKFAEEFKSSTPATIGTSSSWLPFVDYRIALNFMLKSNKDMATIADLVTSDGSSSIRRKAGLFSYAEIVTH